MLSFTTFACTDFSGKYLDEGMGDEYEIFQEKCETLTVKGGEDRHFGFSSVMDGKLRVTSLDNDAKVSASAMMSDSGDVLTIVYMFEGIKSSKQDVRLEMVCKKLENGDVDINMSVIDSEGRQSGTIIFKKL
jgi:hypothetical protein